MERNRLRSEAGRGVQLRSAWAISSGQRAGRSPKSRETMTDADREFDEVRDAVAKWLVQGAAREERSERINHLLAELDSWLRAEQMVDALSPRPPAAAPPPAAATDGDAEGAALLTNALEKRDLVTATGRHRLLKSSLRISRRRR